MLPNAKACICFGRCGSATAKDNSPACVLIQISVYARTWARARQPGEQTTGNSPRPAPELQLHALLLESYLYGFGSLLTETIHKSLFPPIRAYFVKELAMPEAFSHSLSLFCRRNDRRRHIQRLSRLSSLTR